MKGNFTAEKVRSSRKKEGPARSSQAIVGQHGEKLGRKAGRLSGDRSRDRAEKETGDRRRSRALQEGLVSFSCLCKGMGNNVILDVGNRIPLRERIVLV